MLELFELELREINREIEVLSSFQDASPSAWALIIVIAIFGFALLLLVIIFLTPRAV